MADPCQLLQIKCLWTSVYHLQTDGLIKPFYQTLKRILCQVLEEGGYHRDLLLPSPSPSGDFPGIHQFKPIWPIEILISQRHRGLLDITKAAWEEQPTPYKLLIEYVQEMPEKSYADCEKTHTSCPGTEMLGLQLPCSAL